MIKGRSVDAKLHCRIPFGGYAQVHTPNGPTNNALVSRTVGAIALGPTGNAQGTYKFMSLLTGKLIKGRSFTVLPMPAEIIMQVGILAKDQPKDITFADRTGSNTINDLLAEEDDDDFSTVGRGITTYVGTSTKKNKIQTQHVQTLLESTEQPSSQQQAKKNN